MDILLRMTRKALELAGKSGLGFSFDTLNDRDEAHPYRRCEKKNPCT